MTDQPPVSPTQALLPCPFCGSDDPHVDPTGDTSGTVRGGCRNPDCVLFDSFPGNYRDEAHFAECWNASHRLSAIAPGDDLRSVPDEALFDAIAYAAGVDSPRDLKLYPAFSVNRFRERIHTNVADRKEEAWNIDATTAPESGAAATVTTTDIIPVPRGLIGAALHCVAKQAGRESNTYQQLSQVALKAPAIAPGGVDRERTCSKCTLDGLNHFGECDYGPESIDTRNGDTGVHGIRSSARDSIGGEALGLETNSLAEGMRASVQALRAARLAALDARNSLAMVKVVDIENILTAFSSSTDVPLAPAPVGEA